MSQNTLKSIFIIFSLVLFIFAFSIALVFLKASKDLINLSNKSGTELVMDTKETTSASIDESADLNPAFVGIIRPTGLNGIPDEKERLGLTIGDFELTSLNSPLPKIDGVEYSLLYIEDTNFDYKQYEGKCVSAKVKYLNDSGFKPGYGYGGIPVIVSSFHNIEDMTVCSAYENNINHNNETIVTLSGILTRFERPSPDISYDYAITFEQPYLDTGNASGSDQYVKTYVIYPNENELWQKIESSLDQHVEIKGYFTWGYAESKYFVVTEL